MELLLDRDSETPREMSGSGSGTLGHGDLAKSTLTCDLPDGTSSTTSSSIMPGCAEITTSSTNFEILLTARVVTVLVLVFHSQSYPCQGSFIAIHGLISELTDSQLIDRTESGKLSKDM
jgi:hypothetical protein